MSLDTLALISTDFKSAQARNKRNSFILCFIMIFTATFLGYISGWAAEIFTGTHPALKSSPYDADVFQLLRRTALSDWGLLAATGMIVFSILALIWTYYAADKTLLHMNGAIEADYNTYEDLHNVVEEMAIASGLPKPAVYIIQDAGINAFATGLRPDKASVTVTTGLYDVMSRDELQGVIAHEMAHILNRDVQYAVLVAVGAGLIAVFAEIMTRISRLFFYSGSSKSKKDSKGGHGALLIIVGVVWLLAAILAPLVAYLVRMAISREREYLADATAAQLTRNPKGLASALGKIEGHAHLKEKNTATEHLFIINPNRSFSEFASDLTSTHPATSLRIERLMNLK